MASNDALSVLLAVATASAALAMGSVTRPSSSPRRGTRKASAARSRGGGVEGSTTGAVDEDEQLETASTMSAPQKLVPAIQPVAKIIPLDMWAVLCDVVSGRLERNDIRAVATMARMGYSGKLPDVLFSAYTQSAGKTPALKLYFLHRQHTVEAADGSKQRVPSKYGRVMACDLHEHYARVFAKKGSIDKRPTLLETLRECSPDWPIHQVPRIVTFTFRLRDRKIVVFSIPGTANLGDLMVDGSSWDSLRGMLHMIPRGMTLVPQVDGSIAVGTKTYMQSAQDAFQKTASKTALMMYHPGFCSYGGNAFNMIKSHLEGAHAKHPPDEVWLYGHSLGGASAMISTGALWHAYNHKLYPGPVLEAHVDSDNSQPFDAQAYLDKIDSMNPAVMRTDSTQGILHDDDTQGVVKDDSSQDILHDDGTQDIVKNDSTRDILHDDGTQGVVQNDNTQDILHDDGTQGVVQDDSTQDILHDDGTQGVVKNDSTQDILHDDGTQGVVQNDNTQDILHDDGTQGVVQNDSTQDILHDDGTQGVMQDDAFGRAHRHTLSHILSKIDAMRVNRVLREYYDSTQGVGQAASVQDGYSSDSYSSEGFSSDEYSSDDEKSDFQSAGASWLPQVVKPQTSTEEERVSLATVTPSVLNSIRVLTNLNRTWTILLRVCRAQRTYQCDTRKPCHTYIAWLSQHPATVRNRAHSHPRAAISPIRSP